MEHTLWFMGTSYVPGEGEIFIKSLGHSAKQEMAYAECYYFQGKSEEAAELSEKYLKDADPVFRMSACLIYIFSNFSLGSVESVKKGIEYMREDGEVLANSPEPKERAYAAFAGSVARVLLHMKDWESPSLFEYLTDLPKGLRLWGCYFIAYDAYQKGEYERSIGIVETGLAFSPQLYPIPAVYLYLVAAMDAISLKKMEEAGAYFISAWELARADGMFEPIGEHHGLLQGLVEEYLKEEYPEEFRQILLMTERFSYGWQKWHGLGIEGEGAKADGARTGSEKAVGTKEWKLGALTKEEFVIATLANRGWMNTEIAEHLGIEPCRLNQQLKSVYRKLGIANRRQLKKYMLQ